MHRHSGCSAMHPQPQLTCTTHSRVQAPGCPSLAARGQRPKVSLVTAERNLRRGGDAPCARACAAAAPPQAPAEATAQAGRKALPWAQTGAPTAWLVFCWNRRRGGKRKVRRGSRGAKGCPSPSSETDPKRQLDRALAGAVMKTPPGCAVTCRVPRVRPACSPSPGPEHPHHRACLLRDHDSAC